MASMPRCDSFAQRASKPADRFGWECEVATAISQQALGCAHDLRALNQLSHGDALDMAVTAHDRVRQAQRRIRALLVHLGMFVEESAWSNGE